MFPLVMVLAVSCSSPEQLFVFKVPLECGVSSGLGCGTKARPILDTLRTVEEIRWAALNRAGTRLAVRAPKNAEDRILSALAAKGISVTKIADENDVKSLAATITDSTEWYSADHVNQLSRIEAEMIADQLVTPLVTMNLVDQSNRANLEADLVSPANPEEIRGAKEWLSSKMYNPHGYIETQHQLSLTNVFDMNMARQKSPSFDKCFRDISRILQKLRTPT